MACETADSERERRRANHRKPARKPFPPYSCAGKDGRSLLALGGGAGPCDIREVVVHEYDKSSKWLFPRHGDSILRLAGIRRMERW